MTWRAMVGLRPLVLISGLPVGGAENVTVRFLRYLAGSGRSVPVCTLTDRHDGAPADEIARAGIRRHDLGARRLADPRALGRLLQLLHRERFDLIHAHGQDASILAAAASLLRPTPLVVTRHVLEEPDGTARQRARAALALASLRRASAVVAVSRSVATRLLESGVVPDHRLRVIHNGIEPRRFGADRGGLSRAEARYSLGVDGHARVVLVPAVLREGKGHEVLLATLPGLRKRVPEVRVLFAGDGEREADLRRVARDRAVEDVVRFLGFRTDMPTLLAAADVVVLPSLAEALPTVLLEAAAAGRPVVATRIGGIPEVVVHGRTGLLVPVRDEAALHRAVLALLRDDDRSRRMGREARARADERFSIHRQVERTVELWAEVAEERRGWIR